MPDRHDWRLPAVGAAAWLAGIATYGAGTAAAWVVLAMLAAVVVAFEAVRRRRTPRLVAAALLVATAVAGITWLRHEAVAAGPLPELADGRAVAELTATVVSDPRPVPSTWGGEQVVVRLRVQEVTARGVTQRLGATVVSLGGTEWRDVQLGERIRTVGRLAPADDADVAAVLVGARDPTTLAPPDLWWTASGALRASIRDAVAHRPQPQRTLVPALVDGDDAGLPAETEQDFRTTGLTHLTAVSGTNLTLVVGALLLGARGAGVRGRWLYVVGMVGIVGFVLLARTEPSVLRAAVMGAVGLFALGTDGRRRGLRALGVAVTGLLLAQPALAVSPGFALSVLATGGIVLLGPPLQRALGTWLPGPVAAAVAVPLAAQLPCTPVIAALSGEVSLVAVAANLLAAPAVGPATVLGLLAGMVGLVVPVLGTFLGTLAGWSVAWIVLVAGRGAALPGAAIGWGTSGPAIAVLATVCLALAVIAPRLLTRRHRGLVLGAVLALIVVGIPGRLASLPGGWPPAGWVFLACDVGQGDALALATGPGSAVVVDTGPDPDAVDRCLDRAGVRVVPLIVLTHFHADHVDGLAGVLRGRQVGAIEATSMLDPPYSVDDVHRTAADAGLSVAAAPYGVTRTIGAVTLQVLWPDLPQPVPGSGDGSSANNASVVLLVEASGVRLMLTGDVEPPGQARLASALGDLDVDVLKVPHHGSRYQDVDWLTSLRPEIAVVSVGADNDYGHPATSVLDALVAAGAEVARTDTDGDVAVVVEDGEPRLVTAG